MRNKDLKRQKKLLKTKQSLKQFYDLNKSLIEKSIHFGKVEIREHLYHIENLFLPFSQEALEKKRLFNIPFSIDKFKTFKKWSDSTRYFRSRKVLYTALKETKKTQQRQYFRNMEAFRFMYEELVRYQKGIKKLNHHLHEVMKYEKNVRKLSNRFLENRKRVVKLLFSEISQSEKIAKKQFMNDIQVHINAFIDFFFQESERLNNLNKQITKIIVAMDEEIITRCKCMIKEEPSTCLKMPSWKMLLEV